MRWFFVFTENINRRKIPLLKKGFQHCLVFVEHQGITMIIDPMQGGINLAVSPDKPGKLLMEAKEKKYTVLIVEHQPNGFKRVLRSPFMNCATLCAYASGIPFFGITPYQLYRKLKKMGAHEP